MDIGNPGSPQPGPSVYLQEMAPLVELITPPSVLGEGPHWDSSQNCLYYVSIFEQTIHKYVPSTGAVTKTQIDEGYNVTFIIPVEGTTDQFVVGVDRRMLVVRWDGGEGTKVEVTRVLAEVDLGTKNSLNDGKCDPRGRIYSGSASRMLATDKLLNERGSLYRISEGTCTKLDQDISLSNGLAWDLQEKAFYYVDSYERKIRRYDYDVETGDISNMRHIFDLDAIYQEGLPDGLTIDTDGNLWVAVFEGSCVLKINPKTGKLLQKLLIPAPQTTSVTFGGPDLDVLFVTSASVSFTQGLEPPEGGHCYRVTGLGVKGHPNVKAKLN